MGLAIGSPFGLIGAGAGALVGLVYGVLTRQDVEAKAEAEAERQEKIDADLERQIAAQKGAAGNPAAPGSGRKQGVTVVRDHIADGPDRSSAPPQPAKAAGDLDQGGQRGPRVARAAPQTDPDGFRAVYENGRLVRRERDGDGDARPETILHYDADGQLARREESSRPDGRIDTWTFYAAGRMVRRESDTRGEGAVDLWVYYDESGNVARTESVAEAGRKVIQILAGGQVVKEEWRRHPTGEIEAVLTYRNGKVAEREEDSTGSGRLDLVSVFDASGRLVKQGRRAGDDRVASWRYFDQGGTLAREEETGPDGAVVAASFYENGRLVRKELYELDDRLFARAPKISDNGPPVGQ